MDQIAGRRPNLLIVGVPKAGTGSLFSYLAQHPEICPATEKEIGFFSPLSEPAGELGPIASYEAHFARCDAQTYAVEATPNYCYGGPRLVAGVRDMLDQPRIVIILRDPVDRLWSAYTFQRSLMNLSGIRSFEGYVAACEEERRRSLRVNRNVPPTGHLKGLAIGFYGEYLGDWLETFPDHTRVVFFDELSSDPHRVLADLCRWLGIEEEVTSSFDYAVHNRTVNPRSMVAAKAVFEAKRRLGRLLSPTPKVRHLVRNLYLRLNAGQISETMRPETRTHLIDLYRDSNRAVVDLLKPRGYEFPEWLTRT